MADTLRDVLLDIKAKRGVLTAEVVLEEATDPTHPLHHRFEWEDTVAAHKYRLQQAAGLLRVRYKPEGAPSDLRAFWVKHDVTGSPTAIYEPLEDIIADPFQRELMLRQMARDWEVFKRRWEHMDTFVDFVTKGLGGSGT